MLSSERKQLHKRLIAEFCERAFALGRDFGKEE